MKSGAEIIELSNSKIEVADLLFENGFFSDAYYIGGYAFELCLKAKICKTLLIPDFFDFESSKNRKLNVSKARKFDIDNLYRPFKVHDYQQLLILSGLYTEFSNKLIADLDFNSDWSIISKWDESLRYTLEANKEDVGSFIQSLKKMLQWLQQYL